ncbi:MAG: nuclear transport factor 2 family protein [Parvibaculaceae bacterium]
MSTKDLQAVVQSYLDALYHGDVELFRKVFHPQARLFSATGGTLTALDLDQYMEIVKGRPSPAARRDPRQDEVVSLVRASPTTAHARLRNAYLPKHFTDDLTLVHIDSDWRIIAKVWHFDIA